MGKDTFLPHFIRTFGKPVSEMKVAYGPLISNSDYLTLSSEVETWINAKLFEFRMEWNSGEQTDKLNHTE